MTFYRALSRLGYAPEDLIDKEVLVVYRSSDGSMAIGIEDFILAEEAPSRDRKAIRRAKLTYETLEFAPEELLKAISVISCRREP